MHFVVCVKQVPDSSEVRVDPETNTLIREGVPSIINPYDAHAVEEAVRLKEKYGGKVTVISMGPPQAEEVIRKSIQFGADEGILLSDRKFAGSDTLATSYVLTQGIKKLAEREPFDLIFCGKQAIDGDTAQVGPGIAARLKIPQLTYVLNIEEINVEEKTIKLHRKLEGMREVINAKLPALLTVVQDLNELRYASLPNMIRAARYRPQVWTTENIEVEDDKIGLNGSPTAVRKIFAPPEREGGEIIPGGQENPEKTARKLVERLLKEEIIADK